VPSHFGPVLPTAHKLLDYSDDKWDAQEKVIGTILFCQAKNVLPVGDYFQFFNK
jgi:hypothetical protein